MKITKVTQISKLVFEVEFTPNWFEKLIGMKVEKKEYKEYGTYKWSGGIAYADRTGELADQFGEIGKTIDNFRRSW